MNSKDAFVIISKLDSDNDDHWTIDGMPRTDVLADLGLPGLTRAQLTDIAPLFTRTNRELPDLEGMAAKAAELTKEANEAEAKAAEARKAATQAQLDAERMNKTIQDSHSLTRQNQQWIKSQNEQQVQRIAKGKQFAEALKLVGGPRAIGEHPVAVNEAARVRAARRNYTLPQKPSAR